MSKVVEHKVPTVPVIHWSDRYPSSHFEFDTCGEGDGFIPFRIVGAAVDGGAQDRNVFTDARKVGLFPRGRADPVRARSEEKGRAVLRFSEEKEGEEGADFLRFRVEFDTSLQAMIDPVAGRGPPSWAIQRRVDESTRERPFRVNPTPTEGCAFARSAYSRRGHREGRTLGTGRIGITFLSLCSTARKEHHKEDREDQTVQHHHITNILNYGLFVSSARSPGAQGTAAGIRSYSGSILKAYACSHGLSSSCFSRAGRSMVKPASSWRKGKLPSSPSKRIAVPVRARTLYRVDWVAPLVDVPVTLEQPAGKRLSSVSLLTSGVAVTWRDNGDSVELEVSLYEGYDCLLLNYE